MRNFFAPMRGNAPSALRRTARFGVYHFLLLTLQLGILLGTLLGLFAAQSRLDLPALRESVMSENPDFWQVCFWEAAPLLAALLCACAYPGFLAVPGIVFLRGLLLSFSVSALFHAEGYAGLAQAALWFGVPALLTVPPLIFCAAESAHRALRLARLRFQKYPALPDTAGGGRAYAAAFALLLTDLIYLAVLCSRV